MKVTFTPDISTWKSSCECYQCTSKMEINGDDLFYKTEKKHSSDDDWGGGSYMASVYYVICAVCGKDIEINSVSTKMPFLLRKKVEERSKVKK